MSISHFGSRRPGRAGWMLLWCECLTPGCPFSDMPSDDSGSWMNKVDVSNFKQLCNPATTAASTPASLLGNPSSPSPSRSQHTSPPLRPPTIALSRLHLSGVSRGGLQKWPDHGACAREGRALL